MSPILPVLLPLIIVAAALAYDLAFGEYPEAVHPVVWIGRLEAYLDRFFRAYGATFGNGLAYALFCLFVVGVVTFAVLHLAYLSLVSTVVVSAFLLKSTFAIRSMLQHVNGVLDSLDRGDVQEARMRLSRLVRRDTSRMGVSHISSALIESLAEGLVDGVLGPFLFYGLFGIIGAMVYRAANNLDSTVGYKDSTYILFGRPAALIDTLFNYVPARVSPAFIALAGEATGRRARGSAIEFAGLTDSANAGWPMSAMAKLLGVWLEKPGEYIINEGGRNPTPSDVRDAVRIFVLSSLLFIFILAMPIALVRVVV